MRRTVFSGRIGTVLPVLLCAVLVTSCASQGVTSPSTKMPAQEESTEEQKSGAFEEKFYVDITMTGGSGKAHINSPVEMTRTQDGMTAALVWSSENYDYMVVDGVRYDNENAGGPSTFHVPVKTLDVPLSVIGDTVAMSTPHEIEYEISWGEISDDMTGGNGDAEDVAETAGGMNTDDTAGLETELAALLPQQTGTLPLQYARGFSVTYYQDYTVISIKRSGVYLIVPEGVDVPAGLPDGVIVLKRPLDHAYLVSTSAMDLINSFGGLSMIRLSGTKGSDWYVDEAKAAMERGEILYAGKYSAPDYELILGEGCRLAIENTMIYHEPAAKEKLEELGIPVLVETSSYEEHPLGRLEWVLLYGELFDAVQEAADFYREQEERIRPFLEDNADSGKTVAFFHITAGGLINVRRKGDYITSMIEMAGGHYATENAGESENALSAMNMQMEDFYAQARDADILIYNSTIGGEIGSVSELTERNPLFADFKAVKEGEVYCTERSLFQQISGMADFLQDLYDILHNTDRNYTYINRLE